MNTKTLLCCTFQYILPSREANLLALPSFQCLCGDILMTWNILLFSFKPDLPSARLHLGLCVLFASVLTPGKVHWPFAKPLGVLCWFLNPFHKSLYCTYTDAGWLLKKYRNKSEKLWGALYVWPWTLSPFFWATVSPICELENNLFHANCIHLWSSIELYCYVLANLYLIMNYMFIAFPEVRDSFLHSKSVSYVHLAYRNLIFT